MPRPAHPDALNMLRRDFLGHCGLGLGLGSIALGSLLKADQAQGAAAGSPSLAPKPPHAPAKAKAVIQLFMAGGPSQLELFDYKPRLQELHQQPVPKSFIEGKRFAFIKKNAKCLGTARTFSRYGASGAEISELLPHLGAIADSLAIVRTVHTDNFNHGPAKLMMQTGSGLFGRPSIGSWVLYGLGSASESLPGYVVMATGPRGPRGGSYLWSSGFLSSVYQGVPLRSGGDPILDLARPAGIGAKRQRRVLDAVRRINRERLAVTHDPEIATRIANYEMAYRMQTSAPELMDLSDESPATLAMYGVDPDKPSFARNCLLARRLVERGVRYISLYHTEWDDHGGKNANLEETLEQTCREVDRSSAALVRDLEQRGMLDETLVLWGGEFGRTPMGEVRGTTGRDHHIDAYSVWLAGGGIRGGQTLGTTDELGFYPIDPAESYAVHDLQATLLHLLGLDHLRLTYRFQGRDFRLTDVGGHVIDRLLA